VSRWDRLGPLVGRRIVVTRADDQADELCARLESVGAVPVRCPTIVIVPPDTFADMDSALTKLADYDWVVVTSANGVRYLVDRAEALGLGATVGAARFAVVGARTGRAVEERGATVAFAPEERSGETLGRTLPDVSGRAVLLAQGAKAPPLLARALAERGARVTAVTAYRTQPVAPSGEFLEQLRKGTDALTFTSPSTVEGFVALGPEWRHLARRAVVVTIGPTTTAAALTMGLGVHAEARERSMDALVEALESVLGR
jgi:uroporphyrinogen III methyltransferase/synthase